MDLQKTPQGAKELEERTARFGEDIIVFCKTVKTGIITSQLKTQLIKSGTSIGANYVEASGASTKKDFKNKITVCKKGAQETMHWLRMIKSASNIFEKDVTNLVKEANELSLIFNDINQTPDKKI